MEIKIKQTNIVLTPDIAEYLDKKLQILEKFVDPNDTTALCEVEIGKSTEHHQTGAIFFMEINLTLAGKQFRAVAQGETPAVAIDAVKDELALELGRDKKKVLTMTRRSGAAVKAMLRGIDFTPDLKQRSSKLYKWGKKEFRGYWPFRKDSR